MASAISYDYDDARLPPASPSRWAVTRDRHTARLVAWGDLGPAEVAEFDAHVQGLMSGRLPLVVDLTGVHELHPEAVAWLGRRHAEFGPERPMLVVVVADGHLHGQLTAPDAPQLRLTLE